MLRGLVSHTSTLKLTQERSKEHILGGMFSSFLYETREFLQENLQKWLMDEKARDQFVIRAGTDTEVLWNDARQSKPELVYKRSVSGLKFFNLSALVAA